MVLLEVYSAGVRGNLLDGFGRICQVSQYKFKNGENGEIVCGIRGVMPLGTPRGNSVNTWSLVGRVGRAVRGCVARRCVDRRYAVSPVL